MKVVPHTAMTAESLLEEVEVLRRVRGHDNIIHLLDVMYCAGNYYVVTELCEGGEVLDHLLANGPFEESPAAVLARRVASAVRHIHKCGYVHLDIKPENIVFTGKENDDECRIIDFGMARKISEVAGHLSMVKNEKGSRVGTMAYWAPEQLKAVMSSDGKNLSDVDRALVESDPRACDLWSLGIVLYIMLLGCHPFDPYGRGDEKQMAKAIMKGQYSFDIHGDKLKVSKHAKHLITGLLDPDPATRFTSSDVLQHPFLQSGRNYEAEETLPTSWTQQGYNVKRDLQVDKRIQEADKDHRLSLFNTKRVGDSFARVLLMAVTVNGRKQYRENSQSSIDSESLYKEAFDMFEDLDNTVTIPAIEKLLKTTGDEAEDEVVTSYHKHHEPHLEESRNSLSDRFRGIFKRAPEPHSDPPTTPSDDIIVGDAITFQEFKAFLRKQDCVTRSFKANQVVFSQGSTPQGFYTLLSGKARLEYYDQKRGNQQNHAYAVLHPGSIFGETALVKGEKHRSATIRCTEDSEVLYIPKDVFLGALAGSPALFESLFKVAMRQQAKRLHELVEHLNPEGLQVRHYDPGQMLFQQGESADYMYLIQEGIVGSNSRAPSSRARGAEEMSVTIAERGPGDLIGTSAATGGGGTRYSTAKCLTPVSVLAIPMDQITRLRREEPVFRFYLTNLIQARKEFWQSRIADLERGVSEPQLLPLLLEKERGVEIIEKKVAPVVEEPESNTSWWWIVSPGYWMGSGTSSTATSTDPPNQVGNKLGGLVDQVITEHLDTFQSYARAVSRMKHLQFEAGDYVIKRGDTPNGFFIVDTGTVSVEFRSATSGRLLSLASLGPGDHFGEAALLEGIDSYVISVRCVTGAEILMMDKKEFNELCGDGNSTFANAIRMASQLRQHRWVRNLLKLAKEDKKQRRINANEKRRKDEISRKEARMNVSKHLIEIEDDDRFAFFDRDDEESPQNSFKREIEKITEGFDQDKHQPPKKEMNEVRRIFFQPGELLFKAGAPADAVYMIHRGSFTVTGSDQKTRVLNPGDTYGLERIGAGVKFTETAECSSQNSIVSKIPLETIDLLVEGHDYVSQQLRRHARRTVPLNELERRARIDLNRRASFSRQMEENCTKK